MTDIFAIAFAVMSTIVSSVASLFLKRGAVKLSKFLDIFKNSNLIFGLFLYVIGTVLIIAA